MEYNTSRPNLKLSEYGRNIQKLVDHALTLKDNDERNKIAKVIVGAMGQLNPSVKEFSDFRNKLWDHLFLISDFKLDADSPFPKPSKEISHLKPQKIDYPSYRVPYRHYGNTLFKMIDEACKMQEGAAKDNLIMLIANFMKQSYVTWNRDNVTDEMIFEQLSELSEGKLQAKENAKLAQVREVPIQGRFDDRRKKRNNRNNNNNNGKNNKRR
jgi:Domain of unknown function (DUF4290)